MLPKVVIALVILGILGGGGLYLRSSLGQSTSPTSPELATELKVLSNDEINKKVQTTEERVRALETSVAELIGIVQKLNPELVKNQTNASGSVGLSASDQTRLKTLETTIADLQAKLLISVTPTPTTAASTKKSAVYIPIGGSGGNATDKDWYTIEGYEVTIDTADYPGYTSAMLAANLKLNEKVGIGYIRLYNSTDNSAVTSSDASTTSDQFTYINSSTFQLPAGKKTYKIQLKTSEARQVNIQTVSLKINF